MRKTNTYRRAVSIAAVLAVIVGVLGVAAPAQAAVSFNLRPLSWEDIGLDSNDVTTGPNVYQEGTRVCNTGSSSATTVTATWTWTNIGASRTGVAIGSPPGPWVGIQTGTSATQVTHDLAAGSCFDFYFNLEIVRNAAVYKTTRNYTLTISDGAGATATRNSRIAIMDIQSQSRNYVAGTHCDGQPDGSKDCGIYGTFNAGTGTWNAAPTNVLVGSTYTYSLVSTTATAGYGSYSTMLNFPRGIFEIESVKQVYSAFPAAPWCQPGACPPGTPNLQTGGCCRDVPPNVNGTVTQLWGNACRWQYDAVDPVNDDCTTGAEKNYKAGDTTVTTFTIKIIATGTASITGLVWDGSGASWHYNADYGTQVIAITATAPTSVQWQSGKATSTPLGDALDWSTGYESNNLGFNVYEQNGGERVKLNDSPIAGSALSAGGDAVTGRSYHWLAPTRGPPGTQYWIQDLDLDGSSAWHGPFTVSAESATGNAARRASDSPTLAQLGSPSAANAGGGSVPRVSAAPAPTPASVRPATSLGQGPGVKISVDHEGWYQVPLSDLTGLGLDTSAPDRLHLYAEGVEQPITVRDGNVEFYGLGLDTLQTDTRVYWLVRGAGGGLRIPVLSPTADGPQSDSYQAVVERRDRTIYFSSLLNGSESNFFGTPVVSTPTDQTIDVPHMVAGPAHVGVSLQGVTSGAHHVSVLLNGTPLGTDSFANKDEGVFSAPASSLVEGANTVTLTSSGPTDVSLVDRIQIAYRRSYTTDGVTPLRFEVPGGAPATVGGFSTPDIHVVDVTNPDAPVELNATLGPDGSGGYAASVVAPAHATQVLYAYAQAETPAAVVANHESRLASSANGADMVIVTSAGLKSSFAPLAKLHTRQGMKVVTVDIADVYDEFGFGEESPQALKDFLAYTQDHWNRPPKYLLLGGDGSLDPRGFMGPAGVAADVIPVKLVDTQFMETASDPWYAWSGDGHHAGFALGRMPVRTPAEAQALVAKTVAYASTAKNHTYVLASDGVDPDYDFATWSNQLGGVAPAGANVRYVNRDNTDSRNTLLSDINQGPSVLNYIGHGSIDLWRGDMLTSADPAAMTNTQHPAFFVAMTCLNGYFMDPNLQSLGESMLAAPGGAVAAWASTGQTFPEPQVDMNKNLYRQLPRTSSIGAAVVAATKGIHDQDVLATWALLGDPAMRLR